MSPLLKSSLFTVALVAGLAVSGREASAQVTYVGTFAMTNGATIKCPTSSVDLFNSPDVIQAPWAAVPAQQWAFFLLPNGFYAIMNVQTTLFLEGPNIASGHSVSQNPWSANLDQMWYLYPLGSHFYALVNVSNGNVLTDPNDAGNNGNRNQTSPWGDQLDQWWYLTFLRK